MISVAVMAHPKRADMVDELVESLDRPAKVVWDEIGDLHDTGRRSLEAADPGCTHHLVVQDDAVVCADLVSGVERALAHVPDGHPVGLYVGRVRPFAKEVAAAVAAAGDDASWVTMDGLYWGVGVVVPTAHIEALARWFTNPPGNRFKGYDRRISKWYENRDIRCWYPWPSLVDHRGGDSLAGHGVRRHAHRFLGADRSALDVNWTGPVVEMPDTDRLDAIRQVFATGTPAQRRAARMML